MVHAVRLARLGERAPASGQVKGCDSVKTRISNVFTASEVRRERRQRPLRHLDSCGLVFSPIGRLPMTVEDRDQQVASRWWQWWPLL